jgi:hypothetical protein
MAHKCVAIVQSSYIPWKGYFDLIRAADEFILLDDVQFTKRDWRSRNRIKTKDGLCWLTIPVHTKGRHQQRIADTTISDPGWSERHWQTIHSAYARAPFFATYAPRVRQAFERASSERLSDVNRSLIESLCQLLEIATPITWSSEYHPRQGRNERLIDVCVKSGATDYLSGPSARDYIDQAAFADAGVTVHFVDYSGYREYPQPYPPFEHAVSVLDLLFCTGPSAGDYLRDLSPTRVAS